MSRDVRETVTHHYSHEIRPADAVALFWYSRNRHYFDQNLEMHERCLKVRYEDLTARPEATMRSVYHFAGIALPTAQDNRGSCAAPLPTTASSCRRPSKTYAPSYWSNSTRAEVRVSGWRMDLALLGATELAGLIHDRQLAAVDLLDACIDRYSRHNPALNAVVLTRLDEARQRATAADAALADGISWGPLHGLPMTIKEAFDWEGTPSTWGNPEWADNVTSRDAEAVRRLHNAGAIIYGKTNVPLMLADWQSFNEIYGTTNNPWDLTRVPGGSSGGAAVALATGMAALELGSDIGASIRNPAHYCGVFGHKPTFGVVPTAGHTPPGSIAAPDIAVAGPLAREAADLALALDVLAGPDGLDTAGYHLDLEEPAQTRLDDFRVAVMLESPCCAQDDELTDQLQTTVDRLVSLGVTVDDKARPDMDIERANEVYLLLLRAVTGTGVGDEVYAQHLKGAVRWNEGDRSYRTVLDHGVTLNHREWWALHEERETHAARMAGLLRRLRPLAVPDGSVGCIRARSRRRAPRSHH